MGRIDRLHQANRGIIALILLCSSGAWSRETRSQLERTVRDAEAYRQDKEAALSANAVAKREKAKLEAR